MYESTSSNRACSISGLYVRPRPSRLYEAALAEFAQDSLLIREDLPLVPFDTFLVRHDRPLIPENFALIGEDLSLVGSRCISHRVSPPVP